MCREKGRRIPRRLTLCWHQFRSAILGRDGLSAQARRIDKSRTQTCGPRRDGSGRRAALRPKETEPRRGYPRCPQEHQEFRALLRLASPEQEGIYGRENARLRDIARRLSNFRDAFAIIETFDDLKNKFKSETRNRLRSVRLGLTKRRSQSAREEDVGIVIVEAASALRRAAKRVKTWPLRVDGFAAIDPGLEETFRAGRKALAQVRKDARAENLHELRKRVKDHWYHLRLLEDLWTDMMKASEKSLKELETLLGNDRDSMYVTRSAYCSRRFAIPAVYTHTLANTSCIQYHGRDGHVAALPRAGIAGATG